jgi:SAM-dependent methyltransferase
MSRLLNHLRDPVRLPGLIWKNLRYPFTPAAAEARFDRALGIDTAGTILNPVAHPDGTAAAFGAGYVGTPVAIAEHLIRKIADHARGFTFVDIGAGKGRVLVIAARHPFARVVGVELADGLCDIARRNAAIVARQRPNGPPIEVVHADATTYELPSGPCVVFLYRPFVGAVAERVVQNIITSFRNNPRPITVLYYTQDFPTGLSDPIFRRHEVYNPPHDRMERFKKYGFRAGIFEAFP